MNPPPQEAQIKLPPDSIMQRSKRKKKLSEMFDSSGELKFETKLSHS